MAYNKISNNNKTKEINYLNKDFDGFKNTLVEFSKTYYPNTFNDFTEGSPGMVFMEMAAYVGDILSYYTDIQLQETFLDTAQEKSNIFHLAYTLGYKPKVTAVSSANLDIFQLVPSKVVGGSYLPDYNYTLTFNSNAIATTENGVRFTTQNMVDFNFSSSFNPTEVNVYSIDGNNNPEYYLLKKTTSAFSAEKSTRTFAIGVSQRFLTLNLIDNKIVSIESITDSNGNVWSEVPYLAQDTIFDEIPNTKANSPELFSQQETTPYLLKLKRVQKRFVTRFKKDNTLEIQFGSGLIDNIDEEIVPNSDNIGLGNRDGRSKLNQTIDPTNFLHTKTYGEIPTNTTLTVNYLRGGGIESNVPSNTITSFSDTKITNKPNLNGNTLSFVNESVAVNNPEPATGGGSGDSIEEIRLNTIASFSAQQRVVTKEDYMVRTLSMPPRLGSIAKVYITKDSSLRNPITLETEINNLSSNLYILGYDRNKHLSNLNTATKTNVITYLNHFKTLTDSINIKDAFIINLGIDFEITTFTNISDEQVILNCISSIKNYFSIDKWQINQPIIESEIYNLIGNVEGVQSVVEVVFTNKAGEDDGYSKFRYDFQQATKNGIIYPSMDPSIFEIKNIDSDIRGKIKQY